MTTIALDTLSKKFGETFALRDASFTLQSGSFTALLGPSGCGKTTLLRLVAGFERPDGGAIRFGDRLVASVEGMVAPERRDLGIVFQSYALWPHMSVAGNVGYPLSGRGLSRADVEARVARALAMVSLSGFEHRQIDGLSGGQRQRVALARCLVTGTKIILLDEPLANLDVHLRAEMLDVFADLHRETGATIVFVTHDQSEAMALADRIVVLDHGRVQQNDTPERLYREPANAMVAGFIGRGSLVPARVRDGQVMVSGLPVPVRGEVGGDSVNLLVRPEHLSLAASGIPGTVQASRYFGAGYDTSVVLADGASVVVVSRERLDHGAVVHLDVRDAWIVPG